MRRYGQGLGKVRITRNYANVGKNIKNRISRTRKRVGKSAVKKGVTNFGFSFGG
jgi:hypothetical protein